MTRPYILHSRGESLTGPTCQNPSCGVPFHVSNLQILNPDCNSVCASAHAHGAVNNQEAASRAKNGPKYPNADLTANMGV